MNSYEGLHEKKLSTLHYMSGVVETSFFHPKNVRFSNSKLGWVADANHKQLTDCGARLKFGLRGRKYHKFFHKFSFFNKFIQHSQPPFLLMLLPRRLCLLFSLGSSFLLYVLTVSVGRSFLFTCVSKIVDC